MRNLLAVGDGALDVPKVESEKWKAESEKWKVESGKWNETRVENGVNA